MNLFKLRTAIRKVRSIAGSIADTSDPDIKTVASGFGYTGSHNTVTGHTSWEKVDASGGRHQLFELGGGGWSHHGPSGIKSGIGAGALHTHLTSVHGESEDQGPGAKVRSLSLSAHTMASSLRDNWKHAKE